VTPDARGPRTTRPGPLPHEARAARWSGAMFFCLLAGYFVLRPIRDLMGVRAGARELPHLFRYTLLATLVVAPLFGALVARWPRRRFLAWAYRAFSVQVVAFAVWAAAARGDAVVVLAKTYFVWLSVFTLFLVSVFWGFMADVWRPEAARRTYGRIALGGTAGALAGSFVGLGLRSATGIAGLAAEEFAVFVPVLLVAAALLIEAAVACSARVADAAAALGATPAAERPVGGGAFDGVLATLRSPFLLGIAAYVFLHTVAATVLYIVRAHAVEARGLSDGAQADLFFWSEVGVQSATLALQVSGTAWILAAVGVGGALVATPLAVLGGASALLAASGLVLTVGVHALARVAHFAFSKPGAESLYTTVPRGEKYKAKSFLDTFVYRGGDALGAEGVRAVREAHGVGALPATAIPVGLVAAGVGLALARAAERRRERTG
jgi:AAA family ATP:ADP antiporter